MHNCEKLTGTPSFVIHIAECPLFGSAQKLLDLNSISIAYENFTVAAMQPAATRVYTKLAHH